MLDVRELRSGDPLMPNQPKAGNRGHYISAIPDDLWAKAQAKSAATGKSISEIVRKALEEWVK